MRWKLDRGADLHKCKWSIRFEVKQLAILRGKLWKGRVFFFKHEIIAFLCNFKTF